MGTYAPAMLVQPPVVQPIRFGLLNVATVIDHTGDDHALNGITYKSLACAANLAEFEAACPPSLNPVKVATDGDRSTVVADDLIELYVNLSCKETTLEAMFDEARAIFALGEARALEAAFWKHQLAVPTTTVLNTIAGPAGAFSLTGAVAAIESAMACCYPGRPVIHSDRGTVAYTASGGNHLIRTNSGLETLLGSGWAAYSCPPNTGPDGTPAPAGHTWLYGTSQPVIHRWPTETRPTDVAHILKKDGNGGQTNEPQVLVERSYLPVLDCCAFAVLVCLDSCE